MRYFLNYNITLYLMHVASALLCYNGTLTYKEFGEDPLQKRSLFDRNKVISKLRCSLTTLCGEKAMCFVRSWNARAKHAWIIQRGCYEVHEEDPLPEAMSIPTRAMTCKHERLTDAEYKVCLCQADWCNAAPSRIVDTTSIKSGMWTWVYVFCMGYL